LLLFENPVGTPLLPLMEIVNVDADVAEMSKLLLTLIKSQSVPAVPAALPMVKA
jgi:hypothetical protein